MSPRLPKGFAATSYGPRVLGLALGFVTLASVFLEHGAPWWVWLGPALHGFVWPHLARWRAQRSADPGRAERHNLLADHLAGGLWTAAMAFNMLPSVLMVTLMAMDSVIAGGRKALLRGLLAHAAGALLGLLVFGAHWRPESSMLQLWACMPLLLAHPIVVGHVAHKALAKLERQRADLARLNRHDALSDLYNRGHLDACIRAEFERCSRSGAPATLVLLDFDHFKRVNDTLGHQAGDAAIRNFGQRLKTVLRAADIAGRYGGEEFALLLPHTRAAEAQQLMQRLRESLRSEPLLPGTPMTVSVGAAELSPEIASHEGWLRLADQMLYRAKDRGRDRIEIAGADAVSAGFPQRPAARAPLELQLMASLAQSALGAGLFDPADRLAWFNAAFADVFPQAASGERFADLINRCHRLRAGARVQTCDIAQWLRAADAQRRSQPQRSYCIDLHDGGLVRVEETSLADGWLLALFVPLASEADRAPRRVVRLLPAPAQDAAAALRSTSSRTASVNSALSCTNPGVVLTE